MHSNDIVVPGPGDWAVQASGSAAYWFYSGEGEGKITFDGNTFTIDGGANTIQGELWVVSSVSAHMGLNRSIVIQHSLGIASINGTTRNLQCVVATCDVFSQ